MSSPKGRDVESARALEERGEVEPALQAYLRAGAAEDAARLLASRQRFGKAADTLLEHIRASGASAGDPERRRLAVQAAEHLSRARRDGEAVELLLSVGETVRAAEVLERTGRTVQAARVLAGRTHPPDGGWTASTGPATAAQRLEAAGQLEEAIQAYVREGHPGAAGVVSRRLGRVEDAAHHFAEAGMSYEAAQCQLKAGNRRAALQSLVRVSRESPRYAGAAREAIRLADEMNVLDIRLEHFLTDYIRRGPQDDQDLEAFYVLGHLYERWEHVENADEAWRKVVTRDPEYRDAQARLDGLDTARQRQRDRLERSLKGEGSYWGAAAQDRGLPDLPDLADLSPSGGSAQSPTPPQGPPTAAPRPPNGERASTGGPPGKGGTRVLTGADAVPKPPPTPSPDPISAAPPPSGDARFRPGATVAGRYRIEAMIGEGGMAEVFRAYDLELEEAIAIKVFRSSLTDDESLARFRQEIRLSRQLQQPNVTRVYDLGISGGRRYLTMELLDGASLEDELEGLDMAVGVDYLIQACAGLQAAHDMGIVHRDVKPDNLFITKSGVVKVMDFGIAKKQSAQGFTLMGTIAGTPEYMSPEQVNNFTNVTPATDLYALGIVAFRMFTGELPFEHEELVPLLVMQVQDPPPPPRSLNPGIPASLERVVLKLLQKDPADRFTSCRELTGALEALRGDL